VSDFFQIQFETFNVHVKWLNKRTAQMKPLDTLLRHIFCWLVIRHGLVFCTSRTIWL